MPTEHPYAKDMEALEELSRKIASAVDLFNERHNADGEIHITSFDVLGYNVNDGGALVQVNFHQATGLKHKLYRSYLAWKKMNGREREELPGNALGVVKALEEPPPERPMPGEPPPQRENRRKWTGPKTKKEMEAIGYIFDDPIRWKVCRAEGCGMSITWVRTPDKKKMPIHVETGHGEAIHYDPHFTVCPGAGRYRRKG